MENHRGWKRANDIGKTKARPSQAQVSVFCSYLKPDTRFIRQEELFNCFRMVTHAQSLNCNTIVKGLQRNNPIVNLNTLLMCIEPNLNKFTKYTNKRTLCAAMSVDQGRTFPLIWWVCDASKQHLGHLTLITVWSTYIHSTVRRIRGIHSEKLARGRAEGLAKYTRGNLRNWYTCTLYRIQTWNLTMRLGSQCDFSDIPTLPPHNRRISI